MIKSYIKEKKRKQKIVALCLCTIILILAVLSVVYGDRIYSVSAILKVLSGEEIKGATFAIKTIRVPRMLMGMLSGLAFGIAGNTFQVLLGNSLASPDIIGVTSGASVSAVFSILILGLSGNIVSVIAILAGILVAVLIYGLSSGKGYSNARMVLIGIGMQAFLQGIISWILLKASEFDVSTALRWLSGSLNGVVMEDVYGLTVVVLLAGGALLVMTPDIMMLTLGEAYATTLGVRLKRIRLSAIFCAILLIAVTTSVTGPIASVAFLSGPISSRLVGRGRNNMLVSGLTGAVLVLASDFIGQHAWTVRYPVGVITGLLGAPYLIFLLIRMNRKGGNV